MNREERKKKYYEEEKMKYEKLWNTRLGKLINKGDEIEFKIYSRRHKYSEEECYVKGKYVSYVPYEDYRQGYRPGIIAEYEGKEYWVLPEHVIVTIED